MFECLTKRMRPPGWPAEVEIREVTTDDVLPFFMNGKPDPQSVQRQIAYLSVFTLDGERVFESPEAVGKVPARYFPGLMEVLAEAMRLNTPTIEGEAEHPT